MAEEEREERRNLAQERREMMKTHPEMTDARCVLLVTLQ